MQDIQSVVDDVIHNSLQKNQDDLRKLEVELDTDSDLSDEELVEKAYNEFIRTPQLRGFDSDTRLILLFEATLEDIENKDVSLECNPDCDDKIDTYEFSKNFVETYHEMQADASEEIAIETVYGVVSVFQQRWVTVFKDILTDLIPIVEEMISTDVDKLNEHENFSYVIKDGVIYHESCKE